MPVLYSQYVVSLNNVVSPIGQILNFFSSAINIPFFDKFYYAQSTSKQKIIKFCIFLKCIFVKKNIYI